EIKINSVTRKVVEVVFTSINDIEDSNLTIEEYTEKNPVIQIDIFEEISIITKESGLKYLEGTKKYILNWMKRRWILL
ncbi:TPA: hypothetical protein ACSK94_000752, partial [Listeria innocua]